MGKKGDDHDCVFDLMKKDIEVINGDAKWFYCKNLGGSIKVFVDISIDLADSPEFHDCNYMSTISIWSPIVAIGVLLATFR